MNETSPTEELRRLVADVPVGPPPTGEMLEVRRRHRRNRATVVAAAAGVLVVVGAGAGLRVLAGNGPAPSPTTTPTPPGEEHEGWSRIASPPLSARWDTLGAWTGSEAVFVGGTDSTFNGPMTAADLRDGAAYDPDTGRWRPIAPAPRAVRGLDPHVAAGGRLVVITFTGHWLLYDAAGDAWRTLPRPPQHVSQPTLSLRGGRVYVLSRYVSESPAPVQVLDLRTGHWSALPPSRLGPVLDQRTVVATPTGVVVLGDDLAPREAGDQHQTENAELWDGTRWRRYPASHVMGCCGWQWTGSRIVSTYRVTREASARGGLHTFRAGALDPATGTWSRLPFLPADPTPASWELAAGTGALVLSNGYLYDDATGTSTPVPRPAGAATGAASAVVADGRIVVFGGFRVPPGQEPSNGGQQVRPVRDAWVLPLV